MKFNYVSNLRVYRLGLSLSHPDKKWQSEPLDNWENPRKCITQAAFHPIGLRFGTTGWHFEFFMTKIDNENIYLINFV